MASSFFKKGEGSIPDHFFCPICLELPTQKVFQCKKGHPLCENCHSKCKECPNCRVPFDKAEPIRNLYFESLLDTVVTVDCAYKGCEYHPTRDLVHDHQSKCHFNIEKFGDLIKVCKIIGYGACEFCFNNGNILDAVNHFAIVHGCISTEVGHWQMELIGFKEAADSKENCFWNPVISDLQERNYFILTFACLDWKAGSLNCFSLTMPKVNEFEETIKIEYSLSNNNSDSLEWGIFQNAKHFSKVSKLGPLSENDAPCGFSLQKLKLHILENGSLLLNVRIDQREAKNRNEANEKKVNRLECEKRAILPETFPLTLPSCCPVHSFAQFEARMLKVSKDPTEILVQNLPDSVTKDYIKIIFSKFGEIRSINFVKQGPNGQEVCDNATNACMIEFVNTNSVKKVVEKKGRIFMKKNGKRYRLNVLIWHDCEPVSNNGNGDTPINMCNSQSIKSDLYSKLNDVASMDRDELMRQIKDVFSQSMACKVDPHFECFIKLAMLAAAQYGNLELVKYCIGKGIDVNMSARKPSQGIERLSVLGYTMLDKDKNMGLEKAKLLIENGADVHYKDPLGRSLLHHSVLWGSDAAVKFFLKKGLEVNAVNKAGETPLHVALSKTGVQFLIQKVELLLDHGADLYIKDDKGKSCLDLVEEAPFEYWDQIKAIFETYEEQLKAILEGES